MARRMTPNQKAWQREMLRIENMARSIGIEDVASIKPKTPDKITKKHIAQAEAITMDYVREKAELESAGIKQTKRAKQKKGKSVGGTKKPDYVHKPRRPLTEEEKKQRAENLRRGREALTPEKKSEIAKKGARRRSPEAARKAAETRKQRKADVAMLPRASSIIVSNFFKSWEEVADLDGIEYEGLPYIELGAAQYYYNSMLALLEQIGEAGFARLILLVEQEGKKTYLDVPHSKITKPWVMIAVTDIYGVAKKYNLSYAKQLKETWEQTAEAYGLEELDPNDPDAPW